MKCLLGMMGAVWGMQRRPRHRRRPGCHGPTRRQHLAIFGTEPPRPASTKGPALLHSRRIAPFSAHPDSRRRGPPKLISTSREEIGPARWGRRGAFSRLQAIPGPVPTNFRWPEKLRNRVACWPLCETSFLDSFFALYATISIRLRVYEHDFSMLTSMQTVNSGHALRNTSLPPAWSSFSLSS
jgi:hypothetical protein